MQICCWIIAFSTERFIPTECCLCRKLLFK